ncbi:MAG: TIR domain-containing protein [Bacteroidaceae bacterium]|nr:TIR domain-containing protein [Bacteroidaceae bacterium]
MKTKKYDIFISYRRSSYDTANLIATRLKSAGYSVFFDMETLRSGKFNEQLFNVIETCNDFVLVLPQGALDRCVNEDDWVRLEVQHAMKNNKNIIPVMLNGFQWPSKMPEGLEELCNYHALTASSVEYFDLSMERLQRSYLSSKRHFRYRKFTKITFILVAALALLSVIAWGIFRYLSRDVCTKYATKLVAEASLVHMIATENENLEKEWAEYEKAFNYGAPQARLDDMKNDLLSDVDMIEKYIKSNWTAAGIEATPADIGAYHSFLLYINGINAEDMSHSAPSATTHLTQFLVDIDHIRFVLNNPSKYAIGSVNMAFTLQKHLINIYYAEILKVLSEFPKSSLSTYNEMSRFWDCFPNHYEFGRDQEYYDKIIEKEFGMAEKLTSRQQSEINKVEAELSDFLRDNDTPGVMNDMMKSIDKSVVDYFEKSKKCCSFSNEDNQLTKLTKIVYMGSCIKFVQLSQQELLNNGFNFKLSVVPDAVCNETLRLLDAYEKEHPECCDYTVSMKAYYKALTNEEITDTGVLIYTFSDEPTHPTLKIGDILVEYDGKSINSVGQLANAYTSNEKASFKVLRQTDGLFKPIRIAQMDNAEKIGFMNLIICDDFESSPQ